MAKLYVANTSRQHAQFIARLPESGTILRKPIRSGQQELVYEGELYVIESIIKQNEIYGLKKAEDVSRTKTFTGMAYRIDKPITVENFMIADEKNHEILEEIGAETRANAAIYATAVANAKAEMTGQTVTKSSVTIKDMSKDDPTFNEIYSSEPPAGVQEAKPRRGRPRK